jgi:sugar/nucleoside kinase (ribokinase family)
MNNPATATYEVLGIGAPLIDHVIIIDNGYLQAIQAEKGSMEAIEYRKFRHIIQHAKSEVKVRAGGSCSNTIKGLSRLGHMCALMGKIGEDDVGEVFLNSLQYAQVKSLLLRSSTPTGQLACLVSPDGERTFRDFLGASKEFIGDELSEDIFAGVKLVHIEGYTLLNPGLTLRAMELAKQAGAIVSFDLSNFEVVKKYREQIVHLLSQYVDIVFANAAETHALTQRDPERGCAILKDLCGLCVVLMGPDGCWIGSGYEMMRCYAYPQEPVDTTGAGDLFTAGFLHGFLAGKSLPMCAHYGALTSAAVVKIYGADIPDEIWDELRSEILS